MTVYDYELYYFSCIYYIILLHYVHQIMYTIYLSCVFAKQSLRSSSYKLCQFVVAFFKNNFRVGKDNSKERVELLERNVLTIWLNSHTSAPPLNTRGLFKRHFQPLESPRLPWTAWSKGKHRLLVTVDSPNWILHKCHARKTIISHLYGMRYTQFYTSKPHKLITFVQNSHRTRTVTVRLRVSGIVIVIVIPSQ